MKYIDIHFGFGLLVFYLRFWYPYSKLKSACISHLPLQNGFSHQSYEVGCTISVLLVTPKKLNNRLMSHMDNWWLCQEWKSGLVWT